MIVALFYTHKVFGSPAKQSGIFNKNGASTALTTYILVVGLVYQFVLRGIWEPKGMQIIADELLHTIMPLYTLVYWILFSTKEKINFRDVAPWLAYPVVYLLFVLSRGSISNYYPYPFLNIPEIGIEKVLLNIALILLLIVFITGILVGVKNRIILKFKKK